jgi:Na+/serine symporter
MKPKQSNLWRLVAKSLGEKSGKTDKEADQVAVVRLIMFFSIFITNAFIVYNALRTHHFPNYEIQRCLSQTQEKGSVQ